MINREATIRWKGYDPDDLKPMSRKKVWAVCEGCGKGRWVRKDAYAKLCPPCAMRTDERRQKISESERGEKNHSYGKHPSEETREKMSKAKRGENSVNFGKPLSENHRKNISESLIGENNPMYGKTPSEETRDKMSKSLKGKYGGEKSPHWRGGISFEPYCPKFNEVFKESIREEFGRICFLCPTTEIENGRKLSVHHVNYDKNCLCDDIKCEFVPLCMSCHQKTSFNREYWESMILTKLSEETTENDPIHLQYELR